jgi:Fuc2NAc and GlcNAc transferase
MPTLTGLLLLGVAAGLAAWAGVGSVLRWTGGRRMLDVPNERSSHHRPTPRGGGLGIVAVVVAGGIMLLWLLPQDRDFLMPLLIGGLIVAALGWTDDAINIPAGLRLGVQALVATGVLLLIGVPDAVHVPLAGIVRLGAAAPLLALLWLVGMINAYNFMDGIDGIAGAQGVVAGLGWALLGWFSGDTVGASIGLLLGSACAGFLVWNWAPARIFMGDVGSTFLGFVLAVLVVRPSAAAYGTAIPGVLLVAPFVADASTTLVRRALRRENLMSAHRSHLYQRLVQSGTSVPVVSLGYAGAAALAASVGLAWWLVAFAP